MLYCATLVITRVHNTTTLKLNSCFRCEHGQICSARTVRAACSQDRRICDDMDFQDLWPDDEGHRRDPDDSQWWFYIYYRPTTNAFLRELLVVLFRPTSRFASSWCRILP